MGADAQTVAIDRSPVLYRSGDERLPLCSLNPGERLDRGTESLRDDASDSLRGELEVKVLEEAAPVLPASEASQAPSIAPARTSLRGRRFVTAALLLVMVLVSMEMTITSTAMPTII